MLQTHCVCVCGLPPLVGSFDGARPGAAICWTRKGEFPFHGRGPSASPSGGSVHTLRGLSLSPLLWFASHPSMGARDIVNVVKDSDAFLTTTLLTPYAGLARRRGGFGEAYRLSALPTPARFMWTLYPPMPWLRPNRVAGRED